MSDIQSMTDEEFMDAWTAQGEEVAAGKARLLEFSQEHQRRERKEQLRRMQLSPSDAALLQEVTTEGIESEEAVGPEGDDL